SAVDAHLARKPRNRFLRALAKERIAGGKVRQRDEFKKLRVVVEHLLEVRHQPTLVDGVAGETAGDVVVDSALADVAERQQHHVAEGRVVGAVTSAPEKFEKAGLRELWRAAGAAVLPVHEVHQPAGGGIEEGSVDGNPLAF